MLSDFGNDLLMINTCKVLRLVNVTLAEMFFYSRMRGNDDSISSVSRAVFGRPWVTRTTSSKEVEYY